MKKIAFLALIICFSLPIVSHAAPQKPVAQSSDWDIKIGALASFLPKYSGATKYKILPLPYLHIDWKRKVTFDVINGLGYHFYNNGKGTKAGVGFGYSLGRSHNETALIKPLHSIGSDEFITMSNRAINSAMCFNRPFHIASKRFCRTINTNGV